jgi:hypothetical protein
MCRLAGLQTLNVPCIVTAEEKLCQKEGILMAHVCHLQIVATGLSQGLYAELRATLMNSWHACKYLFADPI